jgi:Trk-type K+ transport system membrane component
MSWKSHLINTLFILMSVLSGIEYIRHPDNLAEKKWFRYWTIAGLFLPRKGLLLWVRFLGITWILLGVILLFLWPDWGPHAK